MSTRDPFGPSLSFNLLHVTGLKMYQNAMQADHRTVNTPEADLDREKGERRIAGCMRRKICVCM